MTLNHQKCQCHAGVSVCVSIGTAGGGATVHSESKLRLNGSRAMSGPVPACSTKRPPPPPPSLPSSGGGGGLERSVPQERGQGEGGEIKSRKREEGMVAAGCKQAAGFSPLLAFLLPPTTLLPSIQTFKGGSRRPLPQAAQTKVANALQCFFIILFKHVVSSREVWCSGMNPSEVGPPSSRR